MRIGPHLYLWPLALLVVGTVFLGGSWAAASRAPGGALSRQGGRYVEGSIGPAPERVNPLFAVASSPERDLADLVFSGLTRPGPGGEPEPDLAESWVVS